MGMFSASSEREQVWLDIDPCLLGCCLVPQNQYSFGTLEDSSHHVMGKNKPSAFQERGKAAHPELTMERGRGRHGTGSHP